VSRRGRLGFVAACLLVFALLAAWDVNPPRPLSSGATVIGGSDRLARDIAPLLR